MQGFRGSFKSAFLAILLAIGLPSIVMLFGAVRHRQFSSASNAAHSQSKSKSKTSNVRTASVVRQVLDQAGQIRAKADNSIEKFESDSQPVQSPVPPTGLTGSVTGHSSIEIPVRSSKTETVAAERDIPRTTIPSEQRESIIFRPVDEDNDSTNSEIVQRLEIQLRSVRKRLEQLAQQQQNYQTEDSQRKSQLLTREVEILDTLKKIGEKQTNQTVVVELRPNEPAIASNESKPKPPVDSSPRYKSPSVETPVRDISPFETFEEQPLEPESDQVIVQSIPAEQTPNEHASNGSRVHENDEPKQIEQPKLPVVKTESAYTLTQPEEKTPVVLPEEPGLASVNNLHPTDFDTRAQHSICIERLSSPNATDLFSMDVHEADIRQFFGKLSNEAKVSILLSPDVAGSITLRLHEARFETAMKAILKSQRLTFEREGDIVIILTADEAHRTEHQNRQMITKLYQPNYLSTSEFNRLIEPLISNIGRHSIAASCQTGLERTGDSNEEPWDQREAVVVRDLPEVITEIDRVLIEMDVPPLQVSIEAKIYSVRLTDSMHRGIDLRRLPCRHDDSLGFADGGLKHAGLACDVPTFVKSIERLADTSVVSSQRIRVLNKHRAEMVIGDRVGLITKSGERVAMMESGTRLIFRPSISADGSVRMEIHPERSYLSTNKQTKLPQQNVTELTTQILVRDGATIAIGGLIAEQTIETTGRAQLVSSIPVVGAPFRHRRERLERTELIILVTPHIVTDCDAENEGNYLEAAMKSRATEFKNQQSRSKRHNLARAHYERATVYFRDGNYVKARQQIEASLRQDKADRDALGLRNKIDHCLTQQTNPIVPAGAFSN